MDNKEIVSYIRQSMQRVPIFSEITTKGTKIQSVIIFNPETKKSDVINYKQNLAEFIAGYLIDNEHIIKKSIKIGNVKIVHKTISRKKKHIPVILVYNI